MTHTDTLRDVMLSNGLPVSPIIRRGDQAQLRFDAIQADDTKVTFLWLGRPVYMVRRNEGLPSPVRGEQAINLN